MPWRKDAPAEPPPPPEAGEAPVVIDPQVERREVEQAKIDTENWEAGVYVGSLSVEDFGTHRREAGLLLGDYGGANVVTVYGAYAFNEHLAAELAISHILGNFSDGQYATIGVTHVPMPEWRVQPFLSIGTGVIRIQPEGTLVGTEDRTDQVAYAGIGVRAYMARRFIVRGELKEYVVFTDRDENEEDVEWKIGFAFFF